MAQLLILTSAVDGEALPALGLLSHRVRAIPAEPAQLITAPPSDVILVDGRPDLASAKSLCKILQTTGVTVPLVLILTEGGLTAVNADWGVADVILDTAGPAEVDARIRLVLGELVIDEATYAARLRGRLLELTYKEFELLKYLAQHAGRVFTRAQLLQEVWGYDFFGGTRTVDVHVRRLRAKLGPEHEQLIGTVRNVGYKFVRPVRGVLGAAGAVGAEPSEGRGEVDEEDASGRPPAPPSAPRLPRGGASWDDARVVRPAAWARGG